MMKVAKEILKIIFLLLAIFGIVDLYPRLTEILNNIQATSTNVRLASISVRVTAEEQRGFINDQQKVFNHPNTRRSIGLFLLAGDNFNRAVAHLERTTGQLNRTATVLNSEIALTLPEVRFTIIEARNQINANGIASKELLRSGEKLIVKKDVELSQVLTNPDLLRAIKGIADNTEQVNAIAKKTDLTAEEIRLASKEILSHLIGLTKEAERFTSESANFVAAINKPRTKKEKAFRALVTAAAIAVPVLAK